MPEFTKDRQDQQPLLEWAEQCAYRVKGYSGKCYSPFVCYVMNLLDKRVHNDEYHCQWVAPFGFVPQATCPKHD